MRLWEDKRDSFWAKNPLKWLQSKGGDEPLKKRGPFGARNGHPRECANFEKVDCGRHVCVALVLEDPQFVVVVWVGGVGVSSCLGPG